MLGIGQTTHQSFLMAVKMAAAVKTTCLAVAHPFIPCSLFPVAHGVVSARAGELC